MAQQTTIEELEKLKAELISKVQNIDQTIELLKTLTQNGLSKGVNNQLEISKSVNELDKRLLQKYANYSKNATMINKVAFILKAENKFLHLRQIAKILHLNEPSISEKDFTTKLYPAIAKLKSTGTIVKYSVGTSNVNTFWGSKNWLNEKGEPKEEHRYDESEITTFGSEIIEI